MNIFAQAARVKLRFKTNVGLISAEDLWDLPLTAKGSNTSLDIIAVGLDRELKAEAESGSFVKPVTTTRKTELQLGFDVVKFVLDTKMAERDVAAEREVKAEARQKIMGILARKKDATLENMSEEELRAELDKL